MTGDGAGRRRRALWALGILVAFCVLLGVAFAIYRRVTPPPIEEVRAELAAGLSADPSCVHYVGEVFPGGLPLRSWSYRHDSGGDMLLTLHGRLVWAKFHPPRPRIEEKHTWASPVTLREVEYETIEIRAAKDSTLPADIPRSRLRDLAALAVASTYGLTAEDARGHTWQPVLSWRGGAPERSHRWVYITLQFSGKPLSVTDQLMVTLDPETATVAEVITRGEEP